MYIANKNSTVFGVDTPFGLSTPFKYPETWQNSLSNLFLQLAVQLYPTGRAFGIFRFGIMDKFHEAINLSFIRFLNNAKSTLDSTFPDNDNFTEKDCDIWEYRFGITTNSFLTVEQRRTALLRRMSRGKNIKARQHIKYIEYQLQLAGFNVYIHENGFIESGVLIFKRPQDITGIQSYNVQHGEPSQHGIGLQHGGGSFDLIANSYKNNESFSVDEDYLWATFFIGGENLGDFANIQESRIQEFRELVLKLKPAHLVAFLFVNYI